MSAKADSSVAELGALARPTEPKDRTRRALSAAHSSPPRRCSPQRSLPRTTAAVAIITEFNRQITELETTLADHFEQHPDADIYLSLPGLGVILGARALGEFGDDPNRYADAKSRKNYAGTSPLTVASGRKRAVLARHVRNRRLYDAIDQWAFCALSTSPGCRTFYDQHRAAGDLHHQALRALGNRLVGILHGCLRTQHHLRRTHRLGTPHQHRRRHCRLTACGPGVSNGGSALDADTTRKLHAGNERTVAPQASAAGYAIERAGSPSSYGRGPAALLVSGLY